MLGTRSYLCTVRAFRSMQSSMQPLVSCPLLFAAEQWTEGGDSYSMGTKGLIAWCVLRCCGFLLLCLCNGELINLFPHPRHMCIGC